MTEDVMYTGYTVDAEYLQFQTEDEGKQQTEIDGKQQAEVYADVPEVDPTLPKKKKKRKESTLIRRGRSSFEVTKGTVKNLLNKIRRVNEFTKRMIKRRLKIVKYVFVIQLLINIFAVNALSIVFIVVNWFHVPIFMYVFAIIDIIKVVLQLINVRDLYFWYFSRRFKVTQYKYDKMGETLFREKISTVNKMTNVDKAFESKDSEMLLLEMEYLAKYLKMRTYRDVSCVMIELFNTAKLYFVVSLFTQPIILLCAYCQLLSLTTCYDALLLGLGCIFSVTFVNFGLWITSFLVIVGVVINLVIMGFLMLIPLSSTYGIESKEEHARRTSIVISSKANTAKCKEERPSNSGDPSVKLENHDEYGDYAEYEKYDDENKEVTTSSVFTLGNTEKIYPTVQ